MASRSLMLAGVAIAALSIGGHSAWASPCPTLKTDVNGLDGQCNLVVTFNADGSTSTTAGTGANYDGSDDALIGVVNNTTSPISSFGVSGSNIFGFDGDGIDVYIPIADNAKDTTGYGGPDGYFTGVTANAGTVNFITPISADGGTDFFSLEQPVNLASPPIIVGPGPSPSPGPTPVPEPVSLVILASGLLGVGLTRRRM